MKELNVESKKFLCSDSQTRWNSTYELFKIVVELEKVFGKFEVKVESKKFLCNDSRTRWNFTYELLKIKVELENDFGKFEAPKHGILKMCFLIQHPTYVRDVVSPIEEDFKICIAIFGFLKKFKVKTDIISTSTKPMTHPKFDNTDSSQSQTRAHEDVVMIDDENEFMGDLIIQTYYASTSTKTKST
uniref:hAT-like transposase RNase-H fold domain-containing protein n=1 Tax=Lactuca sativa TaxID=4236 RepID=A0A9R1WZL1_LACSA|nr:hypothetical protein LSAT_V11C800394850 [Lactuca sativa]